MDFFQIRSDKRYTYAPVITNLFDIVKCRADMALEKCNYHAPLLKQPDCLSAECKKRKKYSVPEELKLMEEEIRGLSIFKVGGIETEIIIVRLDVAEIT